MRVGIDARLWNETGIGRYIRNLVEGLDSPKYKDHTFLIFLRYKEYNSLTFRNTNLQKRLLDVPWHSLQEQALIPNVLSKEKLNLMHFPYFSIPIFYKKPFVVTVHDLIIDHFSTGKASSLPLLAHKTKRAGYKIVLRTAIKNAKHIITPSRATKQEIIDHYHAESSKITVTQEGVDRHIVSSQKSTSKEDPYFLYVGNVYPHKNSERLVDAFSELIKQNRDVRLKFVGKEDFFYKKLQTYVKKNKVSNIDFLGFVPDSLLGPLYKNAIALVAPSLMEGFGLTVLEAMSIGVLVVASKIPAFTEVAGNVPIYFDPKSTSGIAQTLKSVYTMKPSIVSEKIEEGIRQAKKFSWGKMVDATVKIYESSTSV